jgi:hypothetical protein
MLHEWLHQVDWSMQFIMNVPDLYAVSGQWVNDYAACGNGAADPHAWFPSPDSCTEDPDWEGCGLSVCPDADAWNWHLLGQHYDFSRPYVGNHCRDGVMNFGETAIDNGGDCSMP